MDETWRPVLGFEGIYEVSDLGRVRSVDRVAVRSNGRRHTVRGKIRAAKRMPKGHLAVTLVHSGKLHNRTIHRLVLESFVGSRPPAAVARHLNGDPADNRLTNLAWGTASENQRDSLDHGTQHQAAKAACPRGHSYDGPNLRLTKDGRRVCRACMREHDQAFRHGRPFDPMLADERYAEVLAGKRRHKSGQLIDDLLPQA